MPSLLVPSSRLDEWEWPSIGGQVANWIEENCCYGPGSLQGEPYVVDPEFRDLLWRMFQVYPQGHALAGVRRFNRVGICVRKGLAKTEKQGILAFAAIHPEAPFVPDGFNADGHPVGRPTNAPYVPMLAHSREQVETLAFAVTLFQAQNSPDGHFFQSTKSGVWRLNEHGDQDGGAFPLSNSPGARDGARTTLNCFDEPHRLTGKKQLAAHATMDANLPKRPAEQPWSLYVGTAGFIGENSVAEELHEEALRLAEHDDSAARSSILYYWRHAGSGITPERPGGYDFDNMEDRLEAIKEATGPVGEWGKGQFHTIARQWDQGDRTARSPYLDRVWLNKWAPPGGHVFAMDRIARTAVTGWENRIPEGSVVAVGFDGSRSDDSTGFVVADVNTGLIQAHAVWQKPPDATKWQVPAEEVMATPAEIDRMYSVARAFGDPPYWREALASWCGEYPYWREFATGTSVAKMAWAIDALVDALASGNARIVRDGTEASDALWRHLRNAQQDPVNVYDKDSGEQKYKLKKPSEDAKIDLAVCAVLAWQGVLEARRTGTNKPDTSVGFTRVR